ncbi:hypothetical protein BJX76DRAFT_359684 [Aspergillus varians]
MADPFSVITGGAGLVSLGLTLCQGLIAYYGPFTACNSETEAFVTRVKGLSATLELLQSRLNSLQNPPNPHIIRELELVADRIDDCDAALKNLSQALDKCRGYDATGTVTKRGKALAKPLYPFRRDTVLALTNMVQGLQSNLEVAVQVLGLAMTSQIQSETALSLTFSQSIASDVAAVSPSLQRIEHGQQQILQLVTSIQQSHLAVIDQSAASSHHESAPKSIRPRHRRAIHSRLGPGAPGMTLSRASAKSCTCTSSEKWSFRAWGFLSSIRSHRFGCPMYSVREITTVVDGRLTVLNKFFGCSAYFNITVVRENAGLAIHPVISLRSIVDYDAPAFRVVHEALLNRDFDFGDAVLKLRRLFEEGKASPGDTLPNGKTLLHYVIEREQYVFTSAMDLYCQLIEYLALTCQVPLNETANGCTVLDTLLAPKIYIESKVDVLNGRISKWARICTAFMDHGAVITTNLSVKSINPFSPYLEIGFLLIPMMVTGYDTKEFPFSRLQMAVFERSEEALKSLLEQGNQEELFEDMSPFLAALHWPLGLSIMLKFCPSCWLQPLLHQALLCPISNLTIHFGAAVEYDPTIFEKLVSCVAAQRRLLLQQAVQYLRPRQLDALGLNTSQSLVSSQVYRVDKMLQEVGHDLGLGFRDDWIGMSVYHSIGNNWQAAETLYRAGFTDVDELDDMGGSALTSLHNSGGGRLPALMEFMEMCKWFLAKGASLYYSHHISVLPIHKIAREVGEWMGRQCSIQGQFSVTENAIHRLAKEWFTVYATQSTLLHQILADIQHRDCCVCACSNNGCLALNILLQASFYRLRSTVLPGYLVASISDFPDPCNPDMVQPFPDFLAPVIIRSCTFDSLGLRHTCRAHWPRNPKLGRVALDDVAEVQEEDRLLIEQLEDLVSEFELKYRESQVPLPEFLKGYWTSRMEEVLEEQFDDEEARAMQEVGVVVEVS